MKHRYKRPEPMTFSEKCAGCGDEAGDIAASQRDFQRMLLDDRGWTYDPARGYLCPTCSQPVTPWRNGQNAEQI
jgi:DNA-directed RNA polymerase subunit RPC12/RpoP